MTIRIYGNRAIQTLPGLATRPTPSRVRQALFNIWQGRVPGCRWLDLCAGSGAMAAEALCRGAAGVVAIEEARAASQVVAANCQKLATDHQFRLITGPVQKTLPVLVGQQFDLIYCDPPYGGKLYQRVITEIENHQLLAIGGELALEHGADRDLSHELETQDLVVCRQKTYGSVALTFYTAQKTAALSSESAVGDAMGI